MIGADTGTNAVAYSIGYIAGVLFAWALFLAALFYIGRGIIRGIRRLLRK